MERIHVPLAPRLTPDAIATLRAALPNQPAIVILAGADGVFCEGMDLEWAVAVPTSHVMQFLGDFADTLTALARAPGPTVALIDGVAAGGGLAIAAAADLVLATPRASFALPEVFSGLIPAIALPWISRRAGVARARLMAIGTAPLDAAQALGAGLCDQVVDELEPALERAIRRWQRADPQAIAAAKRLDDGIPSPRDALAELASRLDAPETRARLMRLVAGDVPWEES